MDYRRKDKNMGKEICKEIISVIWVKRRVVWISWWQWNWRELGRIRIHFESTINQFSSVQSLSHVWLFLTPWTAVHQASPSITNSWSLLKLMSIESLISSDPLSTPSPPSFNLSQHQDLFKWVSFLHQVAKILEFQLQHESIQWIFRTDFF